MAKSATKKKTTKQPDLFEAAAARTPKAARSAPQVPARSAPKAPARTKSSGRASAESGYTAKHIEVLEGLEPVDRKSTRLNSSHSDRSRMPSSA